MGLFNTQNALVAIVYDDMDAVYASPATLLTADKLKLIGVCKSDSGFKVPADQVDKASHGDEIVLSYKSELDIKMLTKFQPATKTLVESQKVCVVFLEPKFWTVSQEDIIDNIDLAAINSKLTPFGYVILAPQQLRIEDEYKFGSGKVTEVTIKSTLVAETKAELYKELSI